MPRLRLRLINPNSPLSTVTLPDVIGRMTFGRRALFMPVNLAICAAVAPPDWDVEIVDEAALGSNHQAVADVDAVGIGAMTTQANRAYALADAYRAMGVKVILGGIHPSAIPDEARLHADAVCIGDAEGTLPHALNAIANNEPLQPTYNWRDYPEAPIATPRKDLLNPRDYLVFNPIQTTRGCPHDCSFCTTPAIFGRRFRQRAIPDIVDEIRTAQERGSNFFIFSDDNFAGNHRWARELCAALEPLKVKWASQCDILVSNDDKLLAAMRRSGCQGLLLGLESPNPDTLAEARKRYVSATTYHDRIRKLHAHRLGLWGSFIFGFDHDDWTNCQAAVRFAHRAGLQMTIFSILTPYPGTAIYAEYQSQGRILSRDWDRYNGASVVFQPRRFTPQQLAHAQLAAFCDFYHPRCAFSRLKLWPPRKVSWLANLAIYSGLSYYHARHKHAVRLPSLAHAVHA